MIVFARLTWASHGSSAPISTSGASGGFSAAIRAASFRWTPDPLLPPYCVAGPVRFSYSIVVVRPPRGSSSSFGFIRLCCSRMPSIRPRQSALCLFADSGLATRAALCSTVLFDQSLRHAPALFVWPLDRAPRHPGASSMLTFGLARALPCRSTGKSPLPTAVALFGLELKGSPVKLSTCSLVHLADSGCHLIVRNLRTPCSSPHKCSSVFSVLPNQFTSNLPRNSLDPGNRAQTISPKQASPPR